MRDFDGEPDATFRRVGKRRYKPVRERYADAVSEEWLASQSAEVRRSIPDVIDPRGESKVRTPSKRRETATSRPTRARAATEELVFQFKGGEVALRFTRGQIPHDPNGWEESLAALATTAVLALEDHRTAIYSLVETLLESEPPGTKSDPEKMARLREQATETLAFEDPTGPTVRDWERFRVLERGLLIDRSVRNRCLERERDESGDMTPRLWEADVEYTERGSANPFVILERAKLRHDVPAWVTVEVVGYLIEIASVRGGGSRVSRATLARLLKRPRELVKRLRSEAKAAGEHDAQEYARKRGLAAQMAPKLPRKRRA